MLKPSVLVLGSDERLEVELHRMLKEVANVSVADLDGRGAADYLKTKPGAVLVAVGEGATGSVSLVADLVAAGARVIVIAAVKDPDLILQTMRAGAKEFVVEGDQEGLRRAVREQAKLSDNVADGIVVTLFPTRGGVGATSIGTNVAGALQRLGENVCVVDFDLHLGDVLSFLDLPGSYSIADVLSNMARLDRDLIEASVTRHPSGIRVLAQSGKVEEADRVKPADVPQFLAFLRRFFSYIIVDGIRGFDEMSLAVLDSSKKVVMVATQDVPAVRNTKRCLDLFRRLGYPEEKVLLVLNRYQRESKITPEVIADTVGIPVAHTLANDFQATIECINRGLLLYDVAARSKLTKDIEQLAPVIVGQQKDAIRRTGFLGLFSSRKNDGAAGAS